MLQKKSLKTTKLRLCRARLTYFLWPQDQKLFETCLFLSFFNLKLLDSHSIICLYTAHVNMTDWDLNFYPKKSRLTRLIFITSFSKYQFFQQLFYWVGPSRGTSWLHLLSHILLKLLAYRYYSYE